MTYSNGETYMEDNRYTDMAEGAVEDSLHTEVPTAH